VMQPDGVDLGSRVTDAEGVVRFTWTIADDVELGSHEFVATGATSGTTSATFTVAENDDDSGTSPLLFVALGVLVLLILAAIAYLVHRYGRRPGAPRPGAT
jgi:hypothetical protein